MTSPALSNDAAALKLTRQIAANPALAPALIALLEAAGNDPASVLPHREMEFRDSQLSW